MRRALVTLLSCACLAGCARGSAAARPDESATPAEPPAAADAGTPLEEALKRELPELEQRDVVAGPVRARVEAREAVTIEQDGDAWMVTIPVVEDASVTCLVKSGALNAAETLRSMVEGLSEDSELGLLGNTRVAVAAARPVLFVEGLTRKVNPDETSAFGHMKLMVAPTAPHAVGCYMTSLGYAKTFERITLGLVESLEPRGRQPSFIEIHEYRTADVVLGFEHRRGWKNDDGTERSEVVGALVVPLSESTLSWQDVRYAEDGDAKGRLKSLSYFRNADEETTEIVLEHRSAGTYAARGDVAGRLLSGTVKTRSAKPILTELGRNRATRDQLLSGKADVLEVEVYVPGFDPLAFVPERFARHRDGTIETIAAGTTVRGKYDANTGTAVELTTDLGDDRLLVGKRLYVEGRP